MTFFGGLLSALKKRDKRNMVRGKLTYAEALKTGRLDEFAKAYEIKDPHPNGAARFEAALAMLGKPRGQRASAQAASADCSDTQTPSRTSQGASRKRGRGSRGSKA